MPMAASNQLTASIPGPLSTGGGNGSLSDTAIALTWRLDISGMWGLGGDNTYTVV
jgi:hypothetical protein